MATAYYLNTTTGSGYVDPVGIVWGAGNDANPGTSKALPKATFAACALVTANGDILTIAPGTYPHSSAYNQLTTADRTGIVMQGVDLDSANWPIIDGSGLTGAYAVRVRGATEINYMEFRNCNKTAGYVNGTAAINVANANAIITKNNVRFRENAMDYTVESNANITENDCEHIDPAVSSLYTITGFVGDGVTTGIITMNRPKLYGSALNKTPSLMLLYGTNGNTSPIININNPLMAGGSSYGVNVRASYDGQLNIKNMDVRGMTNAAVMVEVGSLCVPVIDNYSIISGGFPALATALNEKFSGCSGTNGIEDQTIYAGGRGTGYYIIRKDDLFDSGTNNLNYTMMLAELCQEYDFHMDLAMVVYEVLPGEISVDNTLRDQVLQILALRNADGTPTVSPCNHTYSHANLKNTIGWTVEYTGAGTWSLVTVPSGAPPADVNSLTLTESVSGLNVIIDLAAGTITGDIWDQTLQRNKLSNLSGVRNYLASKAWLAVGNISTTQCSAAPWHTKSRNIAACDLSGPGSKTIPIDPAILRYYEIKDSETYWGSLGITFSKNFIWPFYLYNEAAQLDVLNNYGYKVALGIDFRDGTNASIYLRSFNIMQIGTDSFLNAKALTDTQIRQWINKVCEALSNRLCVYSCMTHGGSIPSATELDEAQLRVCFDELKRHPNIMVVSGEDFYNIVSAVGSGWVTADGGKTYTRDYSLVPDNFGLKGGAAGEVSPLINAGVDVGLPYSGPFPDIGAHEHSSQADSGLEGFLNRFMG